MAQSFGTGPSTYQPKKTTIQISDANVGRFFLSKTLVIYRKHRLDFMNSTLVTK
jgi:hypothetical protein